MYIGYFISTEALRAKDREHATLLEEKMALQMKMVGITDETWLAPNSGNKSVLLQTNIIEMIVSFWNSNVIKA